MYHSSDVGVIYLIRGKCDSALGVFILTSNLKTSVIMY